MRAYLPDPHLVQVSPLLALWMRDKGGGYPQVRLRIYIDAETMPGRGKADLLLSIQETGSISTAARRMGMSYKHA